MELTVNTSLAELASHVPAAAAVFHRYSLDFCCKGARSLEEACRDKSLEPDVVLGEIRDASAPNAEHLDWTRRPLGHLVDHILSRYHEPLRAELSRCLAMARKVEAVHRAKESCPHGLAEHLGQMSLDLESHMQKEEQILFPLIREGRPPAMPIRVMVKEHDDHAVALRRLRSLTSDYQPPREACATWRALFLGLAQLERDLMEHIHLENYVLFPRSLTEQPAERQA
ncbi:MAG: iron-sulfur cluster repair di-iron protein [Planctomycetota bacterium]